MPGGSGKCGGDRKADEKWTQIVEGMTIDSNKELKQCLEEAGFCKIRVRKNRKGWLCVTAEKEREKEHEFSCFGVEGRL